ncbi:WSC domain-containing protein 2-like [Portunus trituberculatus]|uniref:WSC domain-containing protein 2-like n=1 Tax=Portunus trituberculatus TaxID=210409 RepID=UPI001E1CCE66|nr:WSC domain-containing protein 2-like [Portunus trituberculatus]
MLPPRGVTAAPGGECYRPTACQKDSLVSTPPRWVPRLPDSVFWPRRGHSRTRGMKERQNLKAVVVVTAAAIVVMMMMMAGMSSPPLPMFLTSLNESSSVPAVSGGVVRLWPRDENCSWAEVRFSAGLAGSWLLSFPRSGNTWTRYLLEAATGVFTSSVYNSSRLRELGFLGEGVSARRGTTLTTKTHSLQPLARHPDFPVVAIVRNPAKAILSYWHYIMSRWSPDRFIASTSQGTYRTRGFHKFVREKLAKWRKTYVVALTNTTRIHLLHYELLREAPLPRLQELLAFLGYGTTESRLMCLQRHLDGAALGAQRHDFPYSFREVKAMQAATEVVDKLARARGLPGLPDYTRFPN